MRRAVREREYKARERWRRVSREERRKRRSVEGVVRNRMMKDRRMVEV